MTALMLALVAGALFATGVAWGRRCPTQLRGRAEVQRRRQLAASELDLLSRLTDQAMRQAARDSMRSGSVG